MTSGDLHEFRVSAVFCYSGDLLCSTEILVAFKTELALSASPVNPWNANSVANL